MRIVIDLQGAQTESRFRGIGRYTLSFVQAIVRNGGEHDILLALNGLFPETIEPIRAAFNGLLPQENIRVWHAPGPVAEEHSDNDARREVAKLIREAFLASLKPDIIHLSSLFEGYVDDAVTSIGRFDQTIPVSVSLYDLIPLLNPGQYLKPNPRYQAYYERKINHLMCASSLFAISEFSQEEGREYLDVVPERVVNISTAIEDCFYSLELSEAEVTRITAKFNITQPFILYTGGADERKNLPRLIQAYAALPAPLRVSHQLLFAGKMPEGNIAEFKHLAKSAGLKSDELCFTGYITDEELIQLYNLCELYVFPSWHEGFGLPALEAMACGAVVIGANTTSLPEVIGLDAALFDPMDVTAITAKMLQALQDNDFRATLRQHGLQQAKKFSWDETAKRALTAWEILFHQKPSSISYIDRSSANFRLIQKISQIKPASERMPLTLLAACIAQNQSTGIERQLMLDVSELCQRDSATGVQRVVRSYLIRLLQSPPAGFRVEPVYATQTEGYRYARCFTQRFLGEDQTQSIDDPVQWQRGDIFFGLDMQHHVQLAHRLFYRQLKCEGVSVKFLIHDLLPIQLADKFKDSNAKDLHEQWLAMIATTDGAICVSKATTDAFDDWVAQNEIQTMPTFKTGWVHNGGDIDIDGSQPSQGLPPEAANILNLIGSRPSFLCVSTLEPRKGQEQILEAIQLLWKEDLDINLILVGQQGWKVEALAEAIRKHPEQGQRLFWLQGISDEYLEQVYSASTCLIVASINEGFGLPLIEAARHNLPILARDMPVFREVAGDCALYFSGETPLDLATALKTWQRLFQEKKHPGSEHLSWLTWQQSTEKLKVSLVQENYPCHQLLVDISELVQRDAKSGIQRVVRSILKEWLQHSPAGYRVEPVYATVEQGYRYARRFTLDFLGCSDDTLQDEPIDYAPGDIFFGLDMQPQVQVAQRVFYQDLRRQGVYVQFAVYDLLCVLMPQYFNEGAADGHTEWLKVVAESDGAICISNAVADELSDWVRENSQPRKRPFNINWFHLGADVDNSAPSKGFPVDAQTTLNRISQSSSFLMVGTLEPRKGHMQVLEAFEQLWQTDQDVSLIIVGKQGWMVDALIEKLHTSPELNKRLLWLDGISDEYLEKVYASSTCLIAASYGEGFGLPLIEAAQHKLPIIARDIPVFHEVAGDYVLYFDGKQPEELAGAIQNWLTLYKSNQHPNSDSMHWLTWKESAAQLCKALDFFTPEIRI
jgi:glycosyltransferase involved in cell wall biosynthesis